MSHFPSLWAPYSEKDAVNLVNALLPHHERAWWDAQNKLWQLRDASPRQAFRRWLPMCRAAEATYLSVDFHENDAVRALGAAFDGVRRKWFCPKGGDLALFEAWCTPAQRALIARASAASAAHLARETAGAAPLGGAGASEGAGGGGSSGGSSGGGGGGGEEEEEGYDLLDYLDHAAAPAPAPASAPAPPATATPQRPSLSAYVVAQLTPGHICAICHSVLHEPAGICHSFCLECLQKSLEYRAECPLCRQALPPPPFSWRANHSVKEALREAVSKAQAAEAAAGRGGAKRGRGGAAAEGEGEGEEEEEEEEEEAGEEGAGAAGAAQSGSRAARPPKVKRLRGGAQL